MRNNQIKLTESVVRKELGSIIHEVQSNTSGVTRQKLRDQIINAQELNDRIVLLLEKAISLMENPSDLIADLSVLEDTLKELLPIMKQSRDHLEALDDTLEESRKQVGKAVSEDMLDKAVQEIMDSSLE